MTAPVVFDRKLYAGRRQLAELSGAGNFLVERAAEILAERIFGTGRRFVRALDLSSRKQAFSVFSPRAETWLRTSLSPTGHADAAAEEEALPFAEQSFDLVTSVLSLHAANDLPGTLVQIRRLLCSGGLFVAALFGGETLRELRRAFAAGEAETTSGASPRVAPFADVRDLGALLQRAGFAGPVADLDRVEVRYRAFTTLATDLRAMGETNALAGRRTGMLRSATFDAMLRYYGDLSPGDGFPATFDILYLTGWGPERRLPSE